MNIARRLLRWLIVAPVCVAGCAGLRLPAIDPSGQRIFLPAPASTTIDPGVAAGWQPAFQAPPAPPPDGYCGPLVPYNDQNPALMAGPWGGGLSPYPPAAGPPPAPAPTSPYLEGAATQTDGHLARLNVNPHRVIAPVGREVMLQAGLCGIDGYFVTRQPIEWTLTPDSVGSIIEVDQNNKSIWRQFWNLPPSKTSGQYAVGLTSSFAQSLPRGNPDPSDDVYLEAGRTWISLSSDTEGATHVLAVAPTAAGWNERRDAATVYWVDGQWTLPPPVVASSGGGLLQTRVTRATNDLPVEGWRVRYEIVGGTPAAFDGVGGQATEVVTNGDGVAAVQIVPLGGDAGTTQVQVQVIRVGTSAGDLPRLVVGQGATSVTWTDRQMTTEIPPALRTVPPPEPSPELTVRLDGPATAELGATVSYQATVTNVGRATINRVELTNQVPRELDYLRASPDAGLFGDAVRWQLDPILPGQSRSVTLEYRVLAGGSIRNCVQAISGAARGEDCVVTDVSSQTLSLQLRGPDRMSVPVNERVDYEILVTNTGLRDVSGVTIEVRFDPGLQHAKGASPVVSPSVSIPAGTTQRFPIRFTVAAPGRHCHEVMVRGPEGAPLQQSACIEGVAAAPPAEPPSLQVEWNGPAQLDVGRESGQFALLVTNNGQVRLTDVIVRVTFDPEISASGTRPQAVADAENSLFWTLPVLEAGQQQTLELKCDVRSGRERSCLSVLAGSHEGARADARTCVDIRGGSNPSAVSGGTTAPPAGATLRLRIQRQPAGIGLPTGQIAYRIEVSNADRRNHSDVVLNVRVPDGAEFVRARTPPGAEAQEVSTDRTEVTFRPLLSLRAGEPVTFDIVVRQIAVTIGRLRADVSSLEDRQGTTATE